MRKRRGQIIDGVVLIDKPEQWSSNQALQRVKRVLDAQKAGHTGTLDPFATGLLICCLGKATKLAGRMLDADKQYVATLKFGQETDSGDLTGEVVADLGPQFTMPARDEIETTLKQFLGTITQVPPMTSALKHKGKPMYHYARQGIEIERPAREVTIHDIELIQCQGDTATVSVDCSKGTYIRTLAQDIGRVLGVHAHLIALQRTRIGPFSVSDAWDLKVLEGLDDVGQAVLAIDTLPPPYQLEVISKSLLDS
jgi:tRNA pseudouridine55 synthase